jgi:hypothetical protein
LKKAQFQCIFVRFGNSVISLLFFLLFSFHIFFSSFLIHMFGSSISLKSILMKKENLKKLNFNASCVIFRVDQTFRKKEFLFWKNVCERN